MGENSVKVGFPYLNNRKIGNSLASKSNFNVKVFFFLPYQTVQFKKWIIYYNAPFSRRQHTPAATV